MCVWLGCFVVWCGFVFFGELFVGGNCLLSEVKVMSVEIFFYVIVWELYVIFGG